ncbi:MAG: hypothetical protein M3Q48_06040, partial [Actinomycetota bacterium]|nr:hypothetical protein [Actinomycetota bacterium]
MGVAARRGSPRLVERGQSRALRSLESSRKDRSTVIWCEPTGDAYVASKLDGAWRGRQRGAHGSAG